MNIEQVREYYKNNLPVLLPDSRFRQFRIETREGIFLTLPSIRTPQDLQKHVIKYAPKNVYCSTSCWLNPSRVRFKRRTQGFRNILLSNLILVDIDNNNIENVKKTLSYFEQRKDAQLLKLCHSGGGVHLYYIPTENLSKITPKKRISYIQKKRRIIEKEMIEAGIDLDRGIMTDIMRVCRIQNSLNGNKDYAPCREVTPESLNEAMTGLNPSRNARSVPRTGVSGPSFKHFKFITNNIKGTKLSVLYIEIRKEKNYKRIALDIQKTYNLGTIYVFDTGDRYGLLSLKALSKRRIEKVMRFARASNIGAFFKYGISRIITGKKDETIKLIDIFPGDCKGQFSRPHYNYIKTKVSYIDEIQDRQTLIGSEKNNIFVAVKREAHT